MLKALELVGFKSFADKTRFEFPPGITVIVGPNGSGKSNVVDAIKWVLGEQSAKSLRGKDMADVIFKGTQGPNGRKPAGSASATIILENADRKLALDSDEVHITRRVYQSGEGEYLINGETCRLKDIRGLIRGTGVGTDAYSLIEQGKVERLLQASKYDRRAIFEEAAGISRFNAKKIDAQRRLSRVDQNLVRLRDIVEEVGSRYRSIKSQASKAARYREYTQRLQELRTHVGLHDWRQFSQQTTDLFQRKDSLQQDLHRLRTESLQVEMAAQHCDDQWEAISAQLAQWQEQSATIREAIANGESRLAHSQLRTEELGRRNVSVREFLTKISSQLSDIHRRIADGQTELLAAEREFEETQIQLQTLEREQKSLEGTAQDLRARIEQSRATLARLSALIHELGKQISGLTSQASLGNESRRQLESELAKQQSALIILNQQRESCLAEQDRLRKSAEAIDSNLAAARRDVDQTQATLQERQDEIARFNTEHVGLSQRAEVIHEVEQRLEGINQGAKHVLAEAANASAPIWSDVVGLVADLVQVNVEHANIIDIALGDHAQFVVVKGDQLIRAISDARIRVPGRVGLLPLESPHPPAAGAKISLAGMGSVIGRADQLVQTKPEYEELIRRLLGTTWIVKRLSDALHLHPKFAPQIRLLTLDGEVVDFDGTILLGARQSTVGIVSRRSELRALRREIHRLSEAIQEKTATLEGLRGQLADQQSRLHQLLSEHTETAKLLSKQEHLADVSRQQMDQVQANISDVDGRLSGVRQQNQKIENQLSGDRGALTARETELEQFNAGLVDGEQQLHVLESRILASGQQMTSLKVRLAKAEQRVQSQRGIQENNEAQLNDLGQAVESNRRDLAGGLWACRAAVQQIAGTQTDLLQQQAAKLECQGKLDEANRNREGIERQRKQARENATRLRDALHQREDESHQIDLRLEKLQLEKDQLAQRLKDDYGIDLTELSHRDESESEQAARSEVDAEIADLRQKLGSIGSVNMDALAELESLEQRYKSLDEQYRDLVQSKETLERIIQRINNESRRLFLETLDAIRVNFQQLFRQTFGGGRADVVLEEGVDVLDAGVDIIATPPGKPEFNNSLLSGGEKALAAVSLLMAIFKFRPSPFCVLDEVDAPFDEANIGRFIDVLRSFLGWTKFVIVTHSKKTMTAATTLYGVTMQESGISKRVSVRFEEVGEDGQIAETAAQRDDSASTDAQRGVA